MQLSNCYIATHELGVVEDTSEDSRSIWVATYDELLVQPEGTPSPWAWFRPYGEDARVLPREFAYEQAINSRDRDCTYHRGSLSLDFFMRRDFNPLPPIFKEPLSLAGWWTPYSTKAHYWEVISKFPSDSAIGKALQGVVDTIRVGPNGTGARLKAMFEALDGDAPGRGAFEKTYAELVPLLFTGEPTPLAKQVDSALPRHIPAPFEKDEDTRQFLDRLGLRDIEPAERSGRMVWQLRLSFALAWGASRSQI